MSAWFNHFAKIPRGQAVRATSWISRGRNGRL